MGAIAPGLRPATGSTMRVAVSDGDRHDDPPTRALRCGTSRTSSSARGPAWPGPLGLHQPWSLRGRLASVLTVHTSARSRLSSHNLKNFSSIARNGARGAVCYPSSPMVKAEWERRGTSAVFAVACPCGANAVEQLFGCSSPEGLPSAMRAQAERAAWARFIHAARRGRCKQCQISAGRWLRGEPLFDGIADAQPRSSRRLGMTG
jgi:hypothetical protein